MASRVAKEMQQDRVDGNYRIVSEDERIAELRDIGALNWEQEPLDISPCVKIKKTGEVLIWNQSFAMRPDLCVNCDEYGNTDPSSWRGRHPRGVNEKGEQLDVYTAQLEAKRRPPEAPKNLHFDMSEFGDGVESAHTDTMTNRVQDYFIGEHKISKVCPPAPANADVSKSIKINFRESI